MLYDAVRYINAAGGDAIILHGRAGFKHMNGDPGVSVGYSNRVQLAENSLWQPESIRQYFRKLRISRQRPRDVPELRPEDIIVIPELMLAHAMIAYPEHQKVLFSQNPYLYVEAVVAAKRNGLDPINRISLNIGISKNCMAAFKAVGATRTAYFPVSPRLDQFPYRERKSNVIAYMPRKRPAEAAILIDALRRRGRLRGFQLVEIEEMPPLEVARIIGEAQIFISLLKDEALGFPVMEAMAAGCIVVGYTGHGSEEYFDHETGIPVRDGDLLGLIQSVEQTVERLASDPDDLQRMRYMASTRIHANYNASIFREGLLKALEQVAPM